MRRRVLIGLIAFSAVVAIALELPLGFSLAANKRSSAIATLERDGASLSVVLAETLERGDTTTATRLIVSYAHENSVGAAVIAGGVAVVESSGAMSEELSDPGIPAILRTAAGGHVSGISPGNEGDDTQFYAALSVATTSKEPGKPPRPEPDVLLLTSAAAPVTDAIHRQWLELLAFGFGVVVFAGIVGWLLSRSLLRPLREIEVAVARIGSGELGARAPDGAGPHELRTLAGTVNSMAARLGELVFSQRAFVADASHQLRSPLTALRLRLEADLAGSGGKENVAKALGEVERLGRLVDGLLALARAEGTRESLVRVEVGHVIEERAETWRPLAEDSGIVLEVRADAPAAPAAALAGEGHLEQMLDNLIANAIEVTPAGRRIELSHQVVGGWVETHVVDEGPGMNADDRRRAFDRFWRGAAAEASGSGLGLAIVEQLARVSGGSAELLASEGGGVDAVLRLRSAPPLRHRH